MFLVNKMYHFYDRGRFYITWGVFMLEYDTNYMFSSYARDTIVNKVDFISAVRNNLKKNNISLALVYDHILKVFQKLSSALT